MNIHPNVFISYSHDSKVHEDWVLKLASDLRQHGVNAILDKWDLHIGKDLRFFMEQGLSSSNFVLCVCSEEYVKKVNGGKGGAGYEGMIMTQDLLTDSNKDYILPIIRNNTSADKVPKAMGSKLYIDFSNDSEYIRNYTLLLERIYGENSKKKPILGTSPFSTDLSEQISIKKQINAVQYHSVTMDGNVCFRFDNNNGIYLIGDGEYCFETKWSRAGNNSIHAYGKIGYLVGATDFPTWSEIINYDFSSYCRTIQTGSIVIFQNQYGKFSAIKIGNVKSSNHGHPYDEMEFSYHIYGGE